MSENNNGKKPAVLTVGTPQCAVACAFLGAVIAVLFLTIGFWKTLFIALFVFAGLFAGGVSDKGECVRSVTEAVLPRREVRVYQAQDKRTVSRTEEAEEADEEADEEAPDDADGEEDAEESEEEETEEDAEEETEEETEEEETEDAEEDEEDAEDGNADRKTEKEA